MNFKVILFAGIFVAIIFSFTTSFAFAHPHSGQIMIDGHIHEPQTEIIPLNGVMALEKSTIFFHISEENSLPWGFIEKIRGDSMIDVGILDRDYVVVQKQQTASNGQIVAALVDGEEATVKTFKRTANGITLLPANDEYEPMVFTGGIDILGVVVAVLRRVE